MRKDLRKKEAKLQLHRETLRALAQLEDAKLDKVDGGSAAGTTCVHSCWNGICVLK